jgi:rhamnogalacturonan acetylesterase
MRMEVKLSTRIKHFNARALLLGIVSIATLAMGAADDKPPAVNSSTPVSNPKLPTVFIIGDSTVKNGRDNGAGGLWGWGNPIAGYFDKSRINVENRALGGTSSRSFQTSGLWDKVLAAVKPGDFVIMQFGHNDGGGALDDSRARATIRGSGDESREVTLQGSGRTEVVHTFGWYMRKYIADSKGKGATPIVCSLIPRNDWKDGKVGRASTSYGKWAADAARTGEAYFVDLNEIIAKRYEEIGQEKVTKEFFVSEHTHTSLAGAKLNAECVIEGLKSLKDCPLVPFISTNQ